MLNDWSPCCIKIFLENLTKQIHFWCHQNLKQCENNSLHISFKINIIKKKVAYTAIAHIYISFAVQLFYETDENFKIKKVLSILLSNQKNIFYYMYFDLANTSISIQISRHLSYYFKIIFLLSVTFSVTYIYLIIFSQNRTTWIKKHTWSNSVVFY